MRRIARTLALLAALSSAACGDKPTTQQAGADAPDGKPLPTPGGSRGSVTGMPDSDARAVDPSLPPPALVALDGSEDPAMATDAGPDDAERMADEVPIIEGVPDTVAPAAVAVTIEPTAQEAVAVLRAYYEAINAGAHDRAYRLWADEGRASGQSPEQFANGFADSASIQVEPMAPGRVGAAAGSRFVELPVAVTTTLRDGSVHRYVGAYTLRRATIDGATNEQRAWRISAADIREVRP